MKWWQWLIPAGSAAGVIRTIEAKLEADMLLWATWPEEQRKNASSLVVELLDQIIPDYSLDRGFHVQFIAYAMRHDSKTLLELAKHLDGMARSAETLEFEPLRMAADTIKGFVLMFALNTRSAWAMRQRRRVYEGGSRAINDIVQSYLVHRLKGDLAN